MELRELKYFLAVAQAGSISGAAEALYITQPSLSRQMQNLEREVGGALFERGKRRITLTERGKLLKKRAEEMLELYEKTVSEVSAPAQDVSGEVCIGGGETRAMKIVIRAAIKVQRAHPNVKFRFFSGDGAAVLEKLDKGLLDFGLVLDAPDLSLYQSVKLPHCDRWGALVKAGGELAGKPFVTPDDVRGKKIITSEQSAAKGTIGEWLGVPREDAELAATYNLLYVGSQLAEEGAGITFGLEGIVAGSGSLCFKPLEPPVFTHADLIWKKYAVFSRAAELFLATFKEECKEIYS